MTGRRVLTIELILAWADQHHGTTGQWPNTNTGAVLAAPSETWGRINLCLQRGRRGLPGGDSLVRLLARERGVRNPRDLPALTEELIVEWAQAHHAATGQWPVAEYDPVCGVEGEEWSAIDSCLRNGYRGLPGGDSLAKLLARRLGIRNRTNLPPLSIEAVLEWADLHQGMTGSWPGRNSTPEALPRGETWVAIDACLREGCRGLPGNATLSQLLRQCRAVGGESVAPTGTRSGRASSPRPSGTL